MLYIKRRTKFKSFTLANNDQKSPKWPYSPTNGQFLPTWGPLSPLSGDPPPHPEAIGFQRNIVPNWPFPHFHAPNWPFGLGKI